MKPRRLLWIWMFAIPSIVAFNLSTNDLGGWLSQVQQWTESTSSRLAPQNRYLRDGVAWMHVGLSWLSLGVLGFAIIESVIYFRQNPLRKDQDASANREP